MENWLLIPIGILIATMASLLGIGGGILWAPFLILIKGLEPKTAIMFSMLIQSIGMGTAMTYYIRRKMIFWKLSLGIIPFIFLGLFCGVILNQKVISSNNLEIGLGIIAMILAIFFAFQTEKYDQNLTTNRDIKAPIKLKFATSLFGSLSGLFSIGIGDFIVPLFRSKLKIPMQNSIGISHFMNFTVAFFGGLSHFLLSQNAKENDFYILLFAGLGVFLGAQIGPRLGERIGDLKLKELFIFVLFLLGIHLIYQAI